MELILFILSTTAAICATYYTIKIRKQYDTIRSDANSRWNFYHTVIGLMQTPKRPEQKGNNIQSY